MVRVMDDEDNNHMEDSQVEPRIGDEYQAEIPPMMSASKRATYLSTPLALDDTSHSFLVGRPIQVTWTKKHQNGDENVDMNQSLRSLKAKRSAKNPESKKQTLNLEAVPSVQSSSWEDFEVDSFVLAMYTFGKNFTRVKNFMESEGTGEIVLFYYSKFYNSAKYRCWSDSRKKRNRKCVSGRKLYSGWRQQQILSRLIPNISDETRKDKLVNVSKSFAEGKITLESYLSSVKDLVGLRRLVEAVAIGKEKEDLTVVTSVPMRTKPWFAVSSKSSLTPGSGAYTSLSSADIVNQLTGCSRLSKARCSDIFWEAVWPRLLARGWHSEQPEDRSYFTSKDNIVFIVPGVKQFSRGKLVKGEHYFDSVSDILTRVASEPELLEFETDANGFNVAENSSEGDSSSPTESHRQHYLKSPCTYRGSNRMQFTVVDSSLAAGGKLCDLRNLVSEANARLGDKDSRDVRSKMMPVDAKNQVEKKSLVEDSTRFTIIDTSREKASGFRRRRHLGGDDDTRRRNVRTDSVIKEETLEKVKDSSVKHKLIPRAESNKYHPVCSAPSLKRRRLSACIKSEESLSRESSMFKHSTGDETKETTVCPAESEPLSLDEEEKGKDETASLVAEAQEMSEIKPNIRDLDLNRSPKEEAEAVKPPSINGSTSNDHSVTQEQQEQEQQSNTDGLRRQSTRKRPLTTRALEAIESGFLTTKRMKSTTTKPRKRESPTKAKPKAQRGEERRSVSVKNTTGSRETLDETEDTKASLLLKEATTEDTKDLVSEHPKLPPIVLKLSMKRG